MKIELEMWEIETVLAALRLYISDRERSAERTNAIQRDRVALARWNARKLEQVMRKHKWND